MGCVVSSCAGSGLHTVPTAVTNISVVVAETVAAMVTAAAVDRSAASSLKRGVADLA